MPLVSPGFSAEGGVLERLDHRAAAEEVEVAALGRRAFVVGVLLRDLGERLRVLAHLGEQALGLGARLVALGLGRVLVGLDEDVAGAALLGRGVALLVLGVVLAQVVFGDRDVLLHRVEVEHHVLDRRLLGRLELGRMRRILVVRLDLGVARRRPWRAGPWRRSARPAPRAAGTSPRAPPTRRPPARSPMRRAAAAPGGAARSWRRRSANASDDMPSAVSASRLTLPSGLRSGANSGSLLNSAVEPLVGHAEVELVGGDQRDAVADDAVERQRSSSRASRTASDRGSASGAAPDRRARAARRRARPA